MRNRLYLVGGVLLVAALGWATWQAMRSLPREPVYDGKPLSYWLSPLQVGPGRQTVGIVYKVGHSQRFVGPFRNAPLSILSDSNAVPFLIKALKRDTWFRAANYWRWLWPKLPHAIQRHLSPPADNREVRWRAAHLLKAMGSIARPSVPALIRAMKEDQDSAVRVQAASALSTLGEGDRAVVSALAAGLKDSDGDVRLRVLQALSELGHKGDRTVIKPLVAALSDSYPLVRQHAVILLASLSQGEPAVVTALVGALKDNDPTVQGTAAEFLGALGRKDEAAATALKAALIEAADGGGARVQVLLHGAREYLDGPFVLEVMLIADEAEVRRQSGPDAAAKHMIAVAGLTNELNNTNPALRRMATNALWKIDREAATKAGVKAPPP